MPYPQPTLPVGDMEKKLSGLTKLVDITCELAAHHDLAKILQIVTAGVCEGLGCERASLFLYDEKTNELHTQVVTELEIAEIRSSVNTGITGWVARSRKIANIPDTTSDARWNSTVDQSTGFQTRNILAAPVISSHDGRLLGVLELMNKFDGCFQEFDEQLIQAFASHAGTALERAHLLENVRRSQELELSIEMGRSIQEGFMPSVLPDIPGYEVAAWWQPTEAVGGDYYDVLPLQDGRLGLVVADVSGHGVGPSLIMASVRAMLHVLTRTVSAPEEILSILAETMAPDLRQGRFITFLIASLDTHKHQLTFANAGHGPAMHFSRETKRFDDLRSTCLPVGFTSDFNIPAGPPISLAPGDLLILATDGTIELRNSDGKMFGRDRLKQIIIDNRRTPAKQLIGILSRAIRDFLPGQHPPDDATLLLIERKLK